MQHSRYAPIGGRAATSQHASIPRAGVDSAPPPDVTHTPASTGGAPSVHSTPPPATPRSAPPPSSASGGVTTELTAKRAELLDLLRHAVTQTFADARAAPPSECSFGVQLLCGACEQILSHGLHPSQFGVFRSCVFWQYVDSATELSAALKQPPAPGDEHAHAITSFKAVVAATQASPTPRTDVGRGRAFLRLAMRSGQLPAYIELLTMDEALLKLWYADSALLRHEDSVCAANRSHARRTYRACALLPSISNRFLERRLIWAGVCGRRAAQLAKGARPGGPAPVQPGARRQESIRLAAV